MNEDGAAVRALEGARVAEQHRYLSAAMVFGIGLSLTALFIIALFALMLRTPYDTWGAVVVGSVLLVISLPFLARESARHGDRSLFVLLVLVLLLKFGAAYLGDFVAFDVYGGVADAAGYHKTGVELAEEFRQGVFEPALRRGITGTDFPGFLNGLVYTVFGATRLGGFLFYAWLGFWGQVFFYRAFTIAVPEGRSATYGRLLFFFPGVVFWSSFMGKDAWMVFGLGLAALGVARILASGVWRGVVPFALGVGAMSLVRPHVAGLVGVAMACGYLVRRPPRELRQLALVAKGLGVAAVAVVALLLVQRTERFLEDRGIDTEQGLAGVLLQASSGAAYGGSQFNPPIVWGPKQVPAAAVTVLFRPFPTEADSTLEIAAAIEGTFLIFLTIARSRWVVAALRGARRQPYVAFVFTYVGMFVIAFSSFANFGLLHRERVQLLPLYFILLSIPPPDKAET